MFNNFIISFTFAFACISVIYSFSYFNTVPVSRKLFSNSWINKKDNSYVTQNNYRSFNGITKMSMMTDVVPQEEATTKSTNKAVAVDDFSKYAIGQEYEGKLVSAKQFGIFVDISTGTNVLLPRSQLSRGNFEKLKALVEAKSAELVKLELIGISAENQTLSGKYMPLIANKVRPDLSTLEGKDFSGKFFQATVISAHDFGLFAEVEEFGVEGLIPTSKLPDKLPKGTVKASYPIGTIVQVQIDDVNVNDKKLILSMKNNRVDVSAFTDVPPSTWIQAVVQSVSNFGLFARPAGSDSTGLVHNSRIPRDLIFSLKKRAPITPGQNKTDVESLFTEGDVIKVRIQSVKVDARRLELSMLPYRAAEGEDDDYIVEGRDPEGEENKYQDENNNEEDEEVFDAESTLLWWRGQPYTKSAAALAAQDTIDEDMEVINESKDIVEGTWRRMFELDMREDAADFSSKVIENELKELAEEIGELDGLDDDILESDRFGTSNPATKARFGSFVSLKSFPAEWKEEMEFFKQLEATETEISAKLRGGQAAELAEFESLLKEVERELEQASSKSSRRSSNNDGSSGDNNTSVSQVAPEPVIEATNE